MAVTTEERLQTRTRASGRADAAWLVPAVLAGALALTIGWVLLALTGLSALVQLIAGLFT